MKASKDLKFIQTTLGKKKVWYQIWNKNIVFTEILYLKMILNCNVKMKK